MAKITLKTLVLLLIAGWLLFRGWDGAKQSPGLSELLNLKETISGGAEAQMLAGGQSSGYGLYGGAEGSTLIVPANAAYSNIDAYPTGSADSSALQPPAASLGSQERQELEVLRRQQYWRQQQAEWNRQRNQAARPVDRPGRQHTKYSWPLSLIFG